MIRLLFFPVRLVLGVTGASVRAGYRAGRIVGFSRLTFFGAGVAVGVLAASPDARRAAATAAVGLRDWAVELRRPPDEQLADTVRDELHAGQATWHLAQPEVSVADGVVVLRGTAGDPAARDALVTAARNFPGVRDVRDELAVAPLDTAPDQ